MFYIHQELVILLDTATVLWLDWFMDSSVLDPCTLRCCNRTTASRASDLCREMLYLFAVVGICYALLLTSSPKTVQT